MTEGKELYTAVSTSDMAHHHTIEPAEAGFRCTDPDCGKTWTAEEAAQALQSLNQSLQLTEEQLIEQLLKLWPTDGYQTVEDRRVFLKSSPYNKLKYGLASTESRNLDVRLVTENEQWPQRINIPDDRVIAFTAALLVLRKAAIEEEKRNQENGLGEIEDHPF